tara:strand:- start:255 stop:638 length:384 start_codon:yes stop_codon:yes gene_type:complete
MKAKLFFVVAGVHYHTRSQAETVAEKLGLSVVTAAECPFCSELNMEWDSQEFCSHPAQYHSQCWKECTIHGSHIMVDVSGVTSTKTTEWKYVRKDYFPLNVFHDLLSTGQIECQNYYCRIDANFYRW